MPTVPVPAHPLVRPQACRVQGTPTDFDFGNREDGLRALGGDNSDAEGTFNICGGRSEHPEDGILGLGKPVVRYLHICRMCVMFDELLLIRADMYTLVTLTFALSEPVHIDTWPCSHECLATSTYHRPAGRTGFLTR